MERLKGLPQTVAWIAVWCLCLLSGTLRAGSHGGVAASVFSADELVAFAKQVERHAASKRARVFILGRQGVPADKLPAGVSFTHTALAVYSSITTTEGRQLKGYAVHNLYQTDVGSDKSFLTVDYPVDFFRPVPVLKAGVLIPSEHLQTKLLEILQSGTAERLHNPRYSVVSNPFNPRFQNCTEYTLDVIFAALYLTDDRAQIKANQRAYFTPHPLKLKFSEKLFGPLMREDFTTADHNGTVQTTTYTAIQRFLEKYGLLSHAEVLTPS